MGLKGTGAPAGGWAGLLSWPSVHSRAEYMGAQLSAHGPRLGNSTLISSGEQRLPLPTLVVTRPLGVSWGPSLGNGDIARVPQGSPFGRDADVR